MDNKTTVNGGIGFWGLLQVALIVLRLMEVINWSWWLVLLPSIISAGIFLIVFGIALVYVIATK